MENELNKIKNCEVCQNNNLTEVLNLGNHPLCDDLIKIGSNKKNEEYPIKILFCNRCKTAHQKYQVSKEKLFTDDYHYRAKVTGDVLNGMKDLVKSCKDFLGDLDKLKVLDIGCNDGSLLNFFQAEGAQTFGIDPTGAAKEAIDKHKVIKGYFDKNNAKILLNENGTFDVITFTNVFAHIEDLPSLIDNLQTLMNENTLLIIENHYLGDVLSKKQFDTFYHEHPRTYSLKSFCVISELMSRQISKFEFVSRYGGNIRVFISKTPTTQEFAEELDFIEQFKELDKFIKNWQVQKKLEITKLNNKYGALPAKAFPGRAAILIKLLDIDENYISAVYEIKGSIKTGYYVPGTRIPILPEADLYKKEKQLPIINLAWHIPKAVRNNLTKNEYLAEVIDIL